MNICNSTKPTVIVRFVFVRTYIKSLSNCLYLTSLRTIFPSWLMLELHARNCYSSRQSTVKVKLLITTQKHLMFCIFTSVQGLYPWIMVNINQKSWNFFKIQFMLSFFGVLYWLTRTINLQMSYALHSTLRPTT